MSELVVLSYEVPVFHENLFKIRSRVAGLKVVRKGKTLLDGVVLCSKASDHDEKFTSAKIFSASCRG